MDLTFPHTLLPLFIDRVYIVHTLIQLDLNRLKIWFVIPSLLVKHMREVAMSVECSSFTVPEMTRNGHGLGITHC